MRFLHAVGFLQDMPRGWHHEGLYMGMHWGWWIFWILVLAVLAWAFVRLLSDERARRRETERTESAEEILRRRFGRGELDEEEFAERMRALRESRGAG